MEQDILASIKNSLNEISAVTWNRVKQVTNLDQSLQLLKDYITNSFPVDISHLPPELQPLWRYREDMSIIDDVVLVGNRVLIPEPLRNETCNLLHSAHQGISAMNERAKSSVFWPGITDCIKKRREHCQSCWRISPSQPNLPPAQPFVPTYPFEAVATDYCDFSGGHYLITVDRFSNWPEIIKVKPNSATSGSAGLIKPSENILLHLEYLKKLAVMVDRSSLQRKPKLSSQDRVSNIECPLLTIHALMVGQKWL